MPKLESDPFSDATVEVYADLAHQAWSGWMDYLFRKSVHDNDGTVEIPAELADRWKRQMNTPYAELSEDEKESDREEARKYLRVMFPALVTSLNNVLNNVFVDVPDDAVPGAIQ